MNDIFHKAVRELGDDMRNVVHVRDFGVDTARYDWVRLYLRDKQARHEIEVLEEKIRETEALPASREELKAEFNSLLETLKAQKRERIKGALRAAQEHNVPPAVIEPITVHNTPSMLIPFLDLDFTKKEIDSFFAELPEGVTRAKKEERISQCRREIEGLRREIAEELSPPERWIYKPDGKPLPYPRGCRWTAFVDTWRKVAARYNGPVNIEGYSIERDIEMEAYTALGLGDVAKLPPLREPVSGRV